jgi:hypothetical protein
MIDYWEPYEKTIGKKKKKRKKRRGILLSLEAGKSMTLLCNNYIGTII